MIKNLAEREKNVLIGGALILALLIIVFGIILPYRAALTGLDAKIEQQKGELQQVRALQAEFNQLKREMARREGKLKRGGGSAFSAIESIVARLGIRDKLVAMRPQPTLEREGMQVETVAARLEKIDLNQLISLLKSFENASTLLNVTSMQIKTRFDDPTRLDAELRIETLRRNG